MTIRPFEQKDFNAWLPLWNDNCFHLVTDDVTAETWRRLTSPTENVFGLGFFDEADSLFGILHYVLHPTTGFIEPVCYMQDLYIAENHRRQGIAKQLVLALGDIGQREKWARIYWFADDTNIAAKNLYKNIGVSINFSLHILPT